MVIDSEQQVLYMFGGRIIAPTPPAPENSYSGLYAYDLRKNSWRLLRSDQPQSDGSMALRSRIGHSMLLNTKTRQLYIFAGQRHKDYLRYYFVQKYLDYSDIFIIKVISIFMI
jgi:N-acetylneuraminic acid mutarotase